MRACKKCGLSLGQLATFCPVCGTVADPEPVQPAISARAPRSHTAPAPPSRSRSQPPGPEPEPRDPPPSLSRKSLRPHLSRKRPSLHPNQSRSSRSRSLSRRSPTPPPSSKSRRARARSQTPRARQRSIARPSSISLEAGDDPLADRAARRDVQRLFDRLSLVLKRSGLPDESLEEIETAAYFGLVDDETCGTKAQREALAKRRDALRRAGARSTPSTAS